MPGNYSLTAGLFFLPLHAIVKFDRTKCASKSGKENKDREKLLLDWIQDDWL